MILEEDRLRITLTIANLAISPVEHHSQRIFDSLDLLLPVLVYYTRLVK